MADKRLTKTDWLLIITVILCAAAIVVRVFVIGTDYPGIGNDEMEITFVSEKLRSELTSLVASDDKYTLKDRAFFGTLSDGYSITSAQKNALGEETSAGEASRNEYLLNGSITAKGLLGENGAYISGCGTIGVGDVLTLETDKYTLKVTITGIVKR